MEGASDEAQAVVRHTARLARLDLTREEVLAFAPHLAEFLRAFGVLAAADVSDVADNTRSRGGRPRTRPDAPHEPLGAERVLAAAPEREGAFFRVPKTVDASGGNAGPR